MTTQSKSIVLLAAMLVVGFALGLFADSTLVRSRRPRGAGSSRRPADLVGRLEDAIVPHSPAQRDSLRIVLQGVSDDNRQVLRDANVRTRAHTDSLRVVLAPMLDSAQRGRLAHALDSAATRDAGRQSSRSRSAP